MENESETKRDNNDNSGNSIESLSSATTENFIDLTNDDGTDEEEEREESNSSGLEILNSYKKGRDKTNVRNNRDPLQEKTDQIKKTIIYHSIYTYESLFFFEIVSYISSSSLFNFFLFHVCIFVHCQINQQNIRSLDIVGNGYDTATH
ncbi:tetratricopeptide repeat domain 1-like protein [Reticulomyxa filosa]|uniref:Tetratricopeptide repeat domain 1-like protein n=1 Tax=Reticulomyxa filosa TaxID=46433 RepID=X6PBQ6_RETFI|nr:tetratricopeptide repeat domain 1-like protein [Reticulomyxa filosa]|eukprot:ETO35489.1 tetratricopeptide repeat domain 1-like protein [Reticulomyxa filosa]